MRRLLVPALMLTACTTLSAHDFWLASSAPAGARTTVTANVGEVFPKGTSFTQPDRVDQWRVLGTNGEIAVGRDFRREGESLAVDVSLPAPGAYLGVMTIGARTIEMKGDEFTDYLKEEGLTQIIAARKAAGESDQTVTERYARYAKIALRNGDGSGAHLTRPAGLKAEFIPSSDPTALRPGQALSLQLIADRKPVSDAEVTAVNASGGSPVKVRTDKDGRVELKLDRPGSWLVKTVHMTRVTDTPGVSWESFWVTLAFQTASR